MDADLCPSPSPNSILEGACRVTFFSLLKVSSEIAVTSAPVSSLNDISWFSSISEMNHVSLPLCTLRPGMY